MCRLDLPSPSRSLCLILGFDHLVSVCGPQLRGVLEFLPLPYLACTALGSLSPSLSSSPSIVSEFSLIPPSIDASFRLAQTVSEAGVIKMPASADGVAVQVQDTRICVVMVGLPARGKSLIAQKGG